MAGPFNRSQSAGFYNPFHAPAAPETQRTPLDDTITELSRRKTDAGRYAESIKIQIDDFLAKEGADLFEKDAMTGKLLKGPDGGNIPKLGLQIDSLKQRAAKKVGAIRGAFSPSLQAGDPDPDAIVAQQELARLEPEYRLKQERYDRLQGELDRITQVSNQTEIALGNASGMRLEGATVTGRDVLSAIDQTNAQRAQQGLAPVSLDDLKPRGPDRKVRSENPRVADATRNLEAMRVQNEAQPVAQPSAAPAAQPDPANVLSGTIGRIDQRIAIINRKLAAGATGPEAARLSRELQTLNTIVESKRAAADTVGMSGLAAAVPSVVPLALAESIAPNLTRSVVRGVTAEGLGAAAEGAVRMVGNDSLRKYGLLGIPGIVMDQLTPDSIKAGARKEIGKVGDVVSDARQTVREALPVSDAFAQSKVGQIAQGIGQAIGSLPAYAIPGLGQLVSFSQIYQEGYDDAIASGATPEQADSAALKYLPAATLDVIGDSLIVGRFLKPFIGQPIRKVLAEFVGRSLGEGITESMQQAWLNVVAKTVEGYDPARPFTQELFDSFVVGAAVGMAAQVPSTAQGIVEARDAKKRQIPPPIPPQAPGQAPTPEGTTPPPAGESAPAPTGQTPAAPAGEGADAPKTFAFTDDKGNTQTISAPSLAAAAAQLPKDFQAAKVAEVETPTPPADKTQAGVEVSTPGSFSGDSRSSREPAPTSDVPSAQTDTGPSQPAAPATSAEATPAAPTGKQDLQVASDADQIARIDAATDIPSLVAARNEIGMDKISKAASKRYYQRLDEFKKGASTSTPAPAQPANVASPATGKESAPAPLSGATPQNPATTSTPEKGSAGTTAAPESTSQPKEPWQMRSEEYLAAFGKTRPGLTGKYQGARIVRLSDDKVVQTSEHGKAVFEAVQAGKPVPQEVLAEYPELFNSQPPASVSDKPQATTPATPEPGPAAGKPAKAPKRTPRHEGGKPTKAVQFIAKSSGLKPESTAAKFLQDFTGRVHRMRPQAFESMRIESLSQDEWDKTPALAERTPDSAAAFDAGENILYLNRDKTQGDDLIPAIVHEMGHFAEKFALGEEFTQREWETLDHWSRVKAKEQYDATASLNDDIKGLINDRRARREWVAMQFARVVKGETEGMSKPLLERLKAVLEMARALVNRWVGDGKLTTRALDAKILELLDYKPSEDKIKKGDWVSYTDSYGKQRTGKVDGVFTSVKIALGGGGVTPQQQRTEYMVVDANDKPLPSPAPGSQVTKTEAPVAPKAETAPEPKKPAPAAQPKSKVDELADKLFDGLLGTPAVRVDQVAFPKERRQMGIDLADAMIADGIRTPEAMARYLDEKFQKKARKFSDSLWSLFRFSEPSLPAAPDWTQLYGQLDQPTNQDDNANREPSPESAVAQPDTRGNPAGDAGSAPTPERGQPDQDAGDRQNPPILEGASAQDGGTTAGGVVAGAAMSGEPPVGPGVPAGQGNVEPVSDVQRGDGSGGAGQSPDGGRGRKPRARKLRDGSGQPTGVDPVSPTPPARENYRITDPESLVGGGPKTRFAKNRKAIETYLELSQGNREPTPEELDTLASYTGWGSFGQELFQGSWDRPQPKYDWRDEDTWLRDHLGRDEWESMQRSIINAHYTDPITVQTMWNMAERMGFAGGRVLEPSMGIGNFFGLMPAKLAKASHLTGIELDRLTGGMAKILYPRANVQIKGYQESKTADNFYDFIVGNWPFANITIADRRYDRLSPSLHNYFFLKALDQVRPGGLVMGITSNSTMDQKSMGVRTALARKGELVAAYRLPAGAFEKYAGTKVVTDIIILKKRPAEISFEDAAKAGWINTTSYDTPAGQPIEVNEYWKAHPDHVLGTLNWGHGTTTGRPGMIVDRPADYEEVLRGLAKRAPKDVFTPWDNSLKRIAFEANDTKSRQNAIIAKGGKFFQVQGEHLAPLADVIRWQVKDAKKNAERAEQLRSLLDLRDGLSDLLYQQSVSSSDLSATRQALKAKYDKFVAAHGPVAESPMLAVMVKANDLGGRLLANLERKNEAGKWVPREILTTDIVRRAVRTSDLSIEDAYSVDRYQNVNIDVARIAKMANATEEQVIAALTEKGQIFRTPAGTWEARDVYLSGNVRQKLREAQDAKEQGLAEMQRNIDALKTIVPKDVPYVSIEPQLGATWVRNDYYRSFIGHLLSLNDGDLKHVSVENSARGYKVKIERDYIVQRPEARTQWGTEFISWRKIIDAAMNNGSVKIMDRDSDGKEYVDEAATKASNAKVNAIREEFKSWIWKDPERAIDLQNTYNDTFNSNITPDYDGSHLRLSGLALNLGTSAFDFRQHQKNAVWRFMVNGRGVGAHEVGTGKTFTIAGLALESRRLGLFRKPLILAHNANSSSIAGDIQIAYPGAKVLYIDNLSPENRNATLQQIALDEWDAVVMPHSLIDRMALREETMMEQARELISELEQEAIDAAEEDNITLTVEDMNSGDYKKILARKGATAKELVKQRERILEQIRKQAQKVKDDAVFFEDLGIDSVIVDEAHIFKKIPIATRQRLKGLNKAGSNRSVLLTMLTDYVKARQGGKGVFLFTGTPITNTVNEAYNMMRYVMADTMERDGVKRWDGWFNAFAEAYTDVELTGGGTWEPVERLSQFVNVPELARFAAQTFDVVYAKNMPEFHPRPTREGRDEIAIGRPFKQKMDVTVPMSDMQRAHLEDIQARAERFKKAGGKEKRLMMLSGDPASPIIYEGEGVKSALDYRLYDPSAPDDPNSKVNAMVNRAMEHYREHPKSTQMIFMERGYYDHVNRSRKNADGTRTTYKIPAFNLAQDIINKLVAQGVPRDEIVVFPWLSKEKRKIAAEAMRRGEIRFAIGGTETMGTGVNAQTEMRAMHHLDAPWMPGELEQRNGRGWRQGNRWNSVLEYRYFTEGSHDGRRWQILLTKDKFIKRFVDAVWRKGEVGLRIIDGDGADLSEGQSEESGDEGEGDFSQSFAAAVGDPRILQRAKIQKKIEGIERRRAQFVGAQRTAADEIRKQRGEIERRRERIAKLERDVETFTKNKPDPFAIVVDGKTYTERKDADAALESLESMVPYRGAEKDRDVGTYAGFTLQVRRPFPSSQVQWRIVGPGLAHDVSGKISSIEANLRYLPQRVESEQAKIADSERGIGNLQSMLSTPFTRQAQLDGLRKQLEQIERELAASPTPPPVWLRNGAPVGSLVVVDGKSYDVAAHRWDAQNWWLLVTDPEVEGSEMVPVAYDKAMDHDGNPIFQPRPFEAPGSGSREKAAAPIAKLGPASTPNGFFRDSIVRTDDIAGDWRITEIQPDPDGSDNESQWSVVLQRPSGAGQTRVVRADKLIRVPQNEAEAIQRTAVEIAKPIAEAQQRLPIEGADARSPKRTRLRKLAAQMEAEVARLRGLEDEATYDESKQFDLRANAIEGRLKKVRAELQKEESAGLARAKEAGDLLGTPPIQVTSAQDAVLRQRLGTIGDKRTLAQRAKDLVADTRDYIETELKQKLVDRYASIKRLERAILGNANIDASASAYKWARLTQNLPGVMEFVLRHSPIAYRAGSMQQRTAPMVYDDGAGVREEYAPKGLLEILRPLVDSGKLHAWEGYIAAYRANRLMAEGKENNFKSQAEIDELLALGQQHPEFEQIRREYVAFQRSILDVAEAAGVVNAQQRALWEKSDYVPFYRIMDGMDGKDIKGPYKRRGIANQRSGVRRLKGADATIDVVENIYRNIETLIDASFKNIAMQRVADLAATQNDLIQKIPYQAVPFKATVEEAKKLMEAQGINVSSISDDDLQSLITFWRMRAPQGKDVVSVMKDGKAQYFRVKDAPLLRSILALGPDRHALWMRMLMAPRKILTNAVTMDPAFMVANTIRDSFSAWVIADSPVVPGLDSAKGFYKSLTNDPSRLSILAAGGGSGHYNRITEGEVRKMFARMTPGQRRSFTESIIDSPGKLWRAWKDISRASENANRIAIRDSAAARGASPSEAAFQALDIMDFGLRGDSKLMNFFFDTVPFLNARMQGLYRLGRGVKHNPARVATHGAIIALGTLALLAANWDRDEYWELPEWDRDMYYHLWLGDVHLRIPKPFEVGQIFSTSVERFVEHSMKTGDTRLLGKRLLSMLMETFRFDPIPQAVKPVAERAMNYSLFTQQPIVSQGDQFKSPEQQYNAFTSETLRELAEAMPDSAPEWLRSPKTLEHFVRGYFGTIGIQVLNGADALTREIGDYPKPPEAKASDFWMVGRFLPDNETKANKYVGQFYDMHRDIMKLRTRVKELRESGEFAQAAAVEAENRDMLNFAPRAQVADKTLQSIRQRQQSVYDSRTLTPQQKRASLEDLAGMRNRIAKQTVEAMPNRPRPFFNPFK